jgi:hypothetical protein
MTALKSDPAASRRAFLSGLGAVGAIGVGGQFSGTILGHREVISQQAEAAKTLSPGYLYGELLAASAKAVRIQLPEGYTPRQHRIAVTSKTEFCRLGCDRGWKDLKPGDRVETSYKGRLGMDAVARWVNANPIYNYGFITRLGVTSEPGPRDAAAGWPQITVIINSGRYYQAEFHRQIIISPTTRVGFANGKSQHGSISGLRVGDFITFAATADEPYLRCERVWGQTIHQLERVK